MAENLLIDANILSVHKFVCELQPGCFHARTITDYELDYYVSGNRQMSINGKKFSFGAGTLVFRRPGDKGISYGSYNCYCLTLDFSKKKTDLDDYSRNSPTEMQELCDNPMLDLIPDHITTAHSAEYIEIFDQLCYNRQVGDSQRDNLLLNRLFFLVLSDVYRQKASEENHESHILTETCKYVQENYGRPISLKELAYNVSLSPSYFLKVFKKEANITPTEYIISIRLANAKQLLLVSDLNMAQIAEMCGFKDASYFSHFFKKRFGITPSEYRSEYKNHL